MANIINRTRKQAFELWIDALESGRYRRTVGALRNNYRNRHYYCGLGVLCDLIAKDGGPQWVKGYYSTFDGKTERLSNRIAKFMGLTGQQQSKLISLNDEDQISFRKLANVIRTEIMPKALLK